MKIEVVVTHCFDERVVCALEALVRALDGWMGERSDSAKPGAATEIGPKVSNVSAVDPDSALAEIAPLVLAIAPDRPLPITRPVVWTDAREALLRETYPAGVARRAIFERLQALPGPPIASIDAMKVRAHNMGLKRTAVLPAASVPDAARATLERAPVTPAVRPALPPVPRQPAPAGPVTVAYSVARQWAGERGLASVRDGMDIDRVNAKRRELGLPEFHLEQPPVRGRAEI